MRMLCVSDNLHNSEKQLAISGKPVKDRWTVVSSPFESGSDAITDNVDMDFGEKITSLTTQDEIEYKFPILMWPIAI